MEKSKTAKSKNLENAQDSDSDGSFEILAYNEEEPLKPQILVPIRTAKVSNMQSLLTQELAQLDQKSVSVPTLTPSSMTTSVTSNGSLEEVQKQMEALLVENAGLKRTVAKSNVHLKDQYEKIMVFTAGLNNGQKTQKDKLVGAQEDLNKSTEENKNLKEEMEVYRNIKKLQEEEIVKLRSKLAKFQEQQDETETEIGIEDLRTELAETNLEKQEIVQKNEQLNLELAQLKTRIEAGKQKQRKLLKELEVLKAPKQPKKNPEGATTDNNNKVKELEKTIVQTNYKLTTTEGQLVKTQEENKRLEHRLDELERQLKKSKTVVGNLTAANDASGVKLNEALEKLRELQAHRCNPQLEEDNRTLRKQLSQLQRTITEHTQEMAAKEAEIVKLKSGGSDQSAENIMHLKAQLYLFENNYLTERAFNESLRQERDQLIEDGRKMKKKIAEMLGSVETSRYMCPKCLKRFTDYGLLEDHVEECLNDEAAPF